MDYSSTAISRASYGTVSISGPSTSPVRSSWLPKARCRKLRLDRTRSEEAALPHTTAAWSLGKETNNIIINNNNNNNNNDNNNNNNNGSNNSFMESSVPLSWSIVLPARKKKRPVSMNENLSLSNFVNAAAGCQARLVIVPSTVGGMRTNETQTHTQLRFRLG